MAPLLQHVQRYFLINGIVLREQHVQRAHWFCGFHRRNRCLRLTCRISDHEALFGSDATANREMERTADTDCTLDPDATAHESNELRRDAHPETGTAILPNRRAIGLFER